MSAAAPPPSTLDVATGPGVPEGGPRHRAVAPWVAAGVAVGITALVAGGLAVGGRGPLAGFADSGPAVLHIGAGFAGGAPGGVVPDAKGLRAGRYVLTGTLPTSPDRGTAWWLTRGTVDAQQVAALATALGLQGAPQRDGHDWVVRRGSSVLRVYDQPGLPFAFDASPDDSSCPSIPTDGYGGPDTSVGCVVTAPAPSTAPAAGPDDVVLGDVARSVSAALGADADVTVWRGTPYGGATLDPTIDGVPSVGAGISLQVAADGVLAASGWLAGFLDSGLDRGDTYPLRSARIVFGDLAALPQPAMACVEPMDGSPACGGDLEVVGAAYGLTLAFDEGRPVLVPAWLFSVKGSDAPFAQVAVEPRYLADGSGSGSGSGSGASDGAPGSTGPDAGTDPATGIEPGTPALASDLPLPVDPATGTASAVPRGPVMPGATLTVTGPRSLLLDVTGGCELQTAEAAAKETATTIVLTYTFQPLPCPSTPGGLASHRSLPVTLQRDLAGRVVVDEDGTPIPVLAAP